MVEVVAGAIVTGGCGSLLSRLAQKRGGAVAFRIGYSALALQGDARGQNKESNASTIHLHQEQPRRPEGDERGEFGKTLAVNIVLRQKWLVEVETTIDLFF